MSKNDILIALSQILPLQHKIPSAVATAARKGLELRKKYNRGGTDVGVNRAKQLSTETHVSSADLKQIYSYFKRHEVDKQTKSGNWSATDPSPGYVAYYLWGGEAGKAWSARERVKIAD